MPFFAGRAELCSLVFLGLTGAVVSLPKRTVAKKGTGELAKAYLDWLYSEEAQEIAAKHALRPRSQTVLKKYATTFKPLQLFTTDLVTLEERYMLQMEPLSHSSVSLVIWIPWM